MYSPLLLVQILIQNWCDVRGLLSREEIKKLHEMF